jgi:hypothetical protein
VILSLVVTEHGVKRVELLTLIDTLLTLILLRAVCSLLLAGTTLLLLSNKYDCCISHTHHNVTQQTHRLPVEAWVLLLHLITHNANVPLEAMRLQLLTSPCRKTVLHLTVLPKAHQHLVSLRLQWVSSFLLLLVSHSKHHFSSIHKNTKKKS